MTPKLVIFDCDGVLVDTEPATDRIIAARLTAHGLPLGPEETSEMFIGGTIQGIADEARRRGVNLPDDWVDGTYTEMFTTLAKGVPVFDGVFALLDQLNVANIATAIASNGPMRKMQITLTPSGLIDRFAGRIYSGHDYTPKPDPAMIHHGMAVASASPESTVFIDDSVNGAKAGIAAGVRTLGFAPEGDDGRRAAIGAEVVTSMDEIASRLGLNPNT